MLSFVLHLLADLFCIALLCLVGILLWDLISNWDIKRLPKRDWKFVRYAGGGNLQSPYPMTEIKAIQFIAKNNCEVMHVDREKAFIFYKPRGG